MITQSLGHKHFLVKWAFSNHQYNCESMIKLHKVPLLRFLGPPQHLLRLFHILGLGRDVEVFEHVREELKGGPLEGVTVPALQHDLVHVRLGNRNFFRVGFRLRIQYVGWVGHSVSTLHLLDCLPVVHS